MSLVSTRSKSKKQKAAQVAGTAGRTVAKVAVVRKAPRAAGAVWAGRRSGKVLRGAVLAVVGVVTLRAIRKRRAGGSDQSAQPAAFADSFPRPSDPPIASVNGTTPGADLTDTAPGSPSPGLADTVPSSTPPHGDELLSDEPAVEPPAGEPEKP
jgi:hypothetical protein